MIRVNSKIPVNDECLMAYNKGIYPNAEKFYYNEMIINEHVRHPHTSKDMEDLINAIKKVANY